MKKYLLTIIPTFLGAALFGFAIFGFLLPKTEDMFLTQKSQMTRELVNAAWSILAFHQAREAQGLATQKQAQALALKEIRRLRYGPQGKDYFWISDTMPSMVMHPYRSDLDGSDLSSFKDPDGKRLFVEMAEMVKKQGSGFVSYGWQWQDDPKRVVPKKSFVKIFPPWGWIIGTGMYTEDVETEMAAMTRTMSLVGGWVLILVASLSFLIIMHGLKMERERAEAMQKLRESEDKFRSISDGALDGIVMMDAKGRISFWNRAAQLIFGYSGSEVMGKELHTTLAPARHLDEYKAAFNRFSVSGQGEAVGKTLELTAKRKDGSEFPIELSVSSLLFKGQWHAVGIVRDITKRLEAQHQLTVSESNYRTVFNTSNYGIFILKQENDGVIDANQRAAEMFGYSPDEIMKLKPEDVCSDNPRYLVEEAWERMRMAIDAPLKPFEWLFRKANGEEFWAEVNLKTAIINDKRRVLAYIEDISERKRIEAEKAVLEDQLRQAQKLEAIGTLAGGIAHDFNNLLTVILGFIQVARIKMSPTYLPTGELQEVEAAGLRAQDLVSQILTYSRQSSTEKQVIDIVPLIKETLKLIGSTLPSNINIKAELDLSKALILGNGTQIQQVILNLATNAAHAMKETGGAFKVAVSDAGEINQDILAYAQLAKGAYYRLTIEDEGIGMDANVLGKIFDPFYSTKNQGEGTGLGLSVVMGIIKDHGGGVNVTSQPGRGSLFEILLPQFKGLEPSRQDAKAEMTRGNGHVLLVDDQQSVLQAVSAMLAQVGYQITTMTSAQKSLAVFQQSSEIFDLVIVDYDMPEMNGLDLARGIVELAPHIPIILVSGSLEEEVAEKAKAAGVKKVLFKPLPMVDFAEIVNQVIKST